MRVSVIVKYRDDKQQVFKCNDLPGIGDRWLTLYYPSERQVIPTEAIAEIKYKITK